MNICDSEFSIVAVAPPVPPIFSNDVKTEPVADDIEMELVAGPSCLNRYSVSDNISKNVAVSTGWNDETVVPASMSSWEAYKVLWSECEQHKMTRHELTPVILALDREHANHVQTVLNEKKKVHIEWTLLKLSAFRKHLLMFAVLLQTGRADPMLVFPRSRANILNALVLDQECEEMRTRLSVTDNFYDVCRKSSLVDDEMLKKIEQRIEQATTVWMLWML